MRERHLPIAATLILSSLNEGPLHPYAIGKQIQQETRSEVQLRATTLYRWIAQLLDSGHLREYPKRPLPAEDDERRRYYEITAAGRRALEAEVRRLRIVLQATERRVARTPRP